MPLFRILVVEDHNAVRQFICSMLRQRANFHVVAEASDGLEAVQLARELQPDLVLLDIGLPKLNGLDAARQIRSLAPNTKILFLSLGTFTDAVKEALAQGAEGYLHKLRAQSDLLPTIEAILGGTQFIGSDVPADQEVDSDARHEVYFHSDDGAFLENVSRFLYSALTAGNPAIVLATSTHSERLAQRLKEKGFDIEDAIREGTYVPLDATAIVSGIMVNGAPGSDAFLNGLDIVIESAALTSKSESPRVAVFGECVGLLAKEGNIEAAIHIEKVGNELLKTHNADILCAYPLSAFHPQGNAEALVEVCAEHTAVHSHRR